MEIRDLSANEVTMLIRMRDFKVNSAVEINIDNVAKFTGLPVSDVEATYKSLVKKRLVDVNYLKPKFPNRISHVTLVRKGKELAELLAPSLS
jgi:hypothetical protein